jgi:uncharacterized membrane protein
MIDRFKDITFYLTIGFAMMGLSEWLNSSFLFEYLSKNLITLLVALLAINTTTVSVIMTKLKDISEKTGVDFRNSVSELKVSRFEQILLIIFAAILLIFTGSLKVLQIHSYAKFILYGLLSSVFVASMHSLFDTANAVFIILDYENKK